MRKYFGYSLLALPFVVMYFAFSAVHGFTLVSISFAMVALIVGCVVAGVNLTTP